MIEFFALFILYFTGMISIGSAKGIAHGARGLQAQWKRRREMEASFRQEKERFISAVMKNGD
jgi:hypothetical protein